MATDNSLLVRRETILHLKSFAPLTSLIAATSIYPENAPANATWPFIRYSAFSQPWGGQDYSGSVHFVDIHVFSNGPGTDHVHNAAAQVIEAMKSLEFAGRADREWIGTVGPLNDAPTGETFKWHSIVSFRVSVAR